MQQQTPSFGDPGDDPGPDDAAAVAIVGMAGRFPGAPSVAALWEMLVAGREGIARFTAAELTAAGVDPGLLADPGYVPAKGVLADADRFDAAFFGVAPRDAALMDPQQRVFLECAWTALEDAGYPPDGVGHPVGVFAGCSLNSYWLGNVLTNPETAGGGFERLADIDKDFLATRVAYQLGLTGPALSVQTACSTSLVAVHLACQSLIAGECDMALAGGVSVSVPLAAGYAYVEGSIASPDGHCRPFDAEGRGTLNGDGVGIVVLKRLEDALADGDTVRAVIRGSAVTNDGRARVGFAAPGVDGQARAIRLAQRVAGVAPDSVGYVEAHGTATAIGDDIELAALTRAFGTGGAGARCVLGAVKSNLGHLDAAAGVTGLIKAALAVMHGRIPPTLHLRTPKPGLGARFAVSAALEDWPEIPGPRRAGVSSFGLGGTNAHVVLEQAPAAVARPAAAGARLLLLSARTPEALERRAADLAGWLERTPDADLADVAFTLVHGRSPMPWRRAVVAATAAQAAALLRRPAEPVLAEPDRAPASGGEPEVLAAAWCHGAPLDAAALSGGSGRRRLALPTYPFARVRHWVEPGPRVVAAPAPLSADGRLPPERWLSVPDWREAAVAAPAALHGVWLVLADAGGVGAALAARLSAAGCTVRTALPGAGFARLGDGRWTVDPANPADHAALLDALAAEGGRPDGVVHAWTLDPAPTFERAQALGALGLIGLVQAVGLGAPERPVRLLVATRGALSTGAGDPASAPENGALPGAVATLDIECPFLAVSCVDLGALGDAEDAASHLFAELGEGGAAEPVAHRGGRRLRRGWRLLDAPASASPALTPGGVYLVTGGLGGIGLAVATHLARSVRARLVLVGRSRPPHADAALAAIAAAGGLAHVETADLGRPGEAARVLRRTMALFGTIHGIVHAAGLPGGGMVLAADPADVARQIAVKAGAAREFIEALGGRTLELFLLCGAQTGVFGGFGQYGYAAANAALAAVAEAAGRPLVVADWDRWQGTGMAAAVEAQHRARTGADLPGGLSVAEGLAVFDRLCATDARRVLVSSRALDVVVAERRPDAAAVPPDTAAAVTRQPRPSWLGPALAPRDDTERWVAALWEDELGIDGIGVEDDFFTLGGDSLTALRLIGAARQRYGVTLGLQEVLQHPTVAGLAVRLAAGAAPAAAADSFEEGVL